MKTFRYLVGLLVVLSLLIPTGIVWAADPTVTNAGGADNITSYSTYLWGNVTSLGSCSNVTARFYWGDNDGVTTPGSWDHNSTAEWPIQPMVSGLFYYNATGLDSHTTYYYRAYVSCATNSSWAGSTENFTTLYGIPSVSDLDPSPIYQNWVTCHGQVLDTGGITGDTANVTVYYGLTDGGTVVGNWTNSESIGPLDIGSYSANITGLSANTTYFYRSYIENPDEEAWASSTSDFETLQLGVATVSTGAAIDITSTGATLSMTLVNDGGYDCTVWIAYGPDQTCEYYTGQAAGVNSGYSFSEAVGSLDPGTKYYYRGVAHVEDVGTAYGVIEHFTTEGVSFAAPDEIEILSIRVFQNIGETGDEMLILRYNLEYEYEPDEPPEDYFMLGVEGYYADLYFYQYGIASLYLDADHALVWEGAYNVTVGMKDGSAVVGQVLTVTDYESDNTTFCAYLINQARYLERELDIDLLTEEGRLNSEGSGIFRKAIPNVMYVCPNSFYKSIVELEVETENWTRSYESNLTSATGSRLSGALTDIGGLLGMSGTWTGMGFATLLALMLGGGVYAVSGNPTAALIFGGATFFPTALMGILPLTPLYIGILIITVMFAILFILGRFA